MIPLAPMVPVPLRRVARQLSAATPVSVPLIPLAPMVPVPLRRTARELSAATPVSVHAGDASGPDGSFTRAPCALAHFSRQSLAPRTPHPLSLPLSGGCRRLRVERSLNSAPRVQPHHEMQRGVGRPPRRPPNSLSRHAHATKSVPQCAFQRVHRRSDRCQMLCSSTHRPSASPPADNPLLPLAYDCRSASQAPSRQSTWSFRN